MRRLTADVARSRGDARSRTRRWYARHCGHADLLRQCIDGSTAH
ncbi:DUF664 domain-containing protein [Nocardioides dongxiaopingii]|nr:DUF664 domain-containing protein [Nocardioides sp. S-1144]